MIDIGTAVGVAERDALGTTARVVVWPPNWTGRVLAAVDAELALLDEQASRFRDDSEISLVQRCFSAATRSGSTRPGDPPLRPSCIVSEGLAEAIAVALAAAEWTGGLVDPTVGGALCTAWATTATSRRCRRAQPAKPRRQNRAMCRAGSRYGSTAGACDWPAECGSTSEPPPKASGPIAPPGRRRPACPVAACWSASAVTSPWRERRRWAAGRCLSATSLGSTAESLPFALPGRCAPRRSRRAGRSGCPQGAWRPRRSAAVSGGARRPATLHHIGWTPRDRPARGGAVADGERRRRKLRGGQRGGHRRDRRGGAGEPKVAGRPGPARNSRLVAHDGSVRLLGGWPATVGGLLKVPATPRMPAAPSRTPDGTRSAAGGPQQACQARPG